MKKFKVRFMEKDDHFWAYEDLGNYELESYEYDSEYIGDRARLIVKPAPLCKATDILNNWDAICTTLMKAVEDYDCVVFIINLYEERFIQMAEELRNKLSVYRIEIPLTK